MKAERGSECREHSTQLLSAQNSTGHIRGMAVKSVAQVCRVGIFCRLWWSGCACQELGGEKFSRSKQVSASLVLSPWWQCAEPRDVSWWLCQTGLPPGVDSAVHLM